MKLAGQIHTSGPVTFARLLLCLLLTAALSSHSLVYGGASSFPQKIPAVTYDLPSFRGELHRLSAILDKKPAAPEIAALRDSLPQSWTVTTPSRNYSISTQSLRNFLTGLDVKKAKTWVQLLESEAKGYDSAQTAVPANARAALDEILARREFAAVHPPSAWEILRQRIARWVQELLLRLFGMVNRYPLGGKIIFWLAIAGALAWIGYWLVLFWTARDRIQALRPEEPAFRVRTWQEWIRAAREAAAQGNFREAVHSAYWAGIVRLQDLRVLPADRAKTPREYLRLAVLPASGELAAHPSIGEPLAALTSRLERVWYGNRNASLDDFQDSLRQLEALGCPLE